MDSAAMDDFVRNLVGRLDVDRPTAERVYLFLTQNVDQVPEWLGLRTAAKAPLGGETVQGSNR